MAFFVTVRDTFVSRLLRIRIRKIRKDLFSSRMIPAHIGSDTTRASILIEFVLAFVSEVGGAMMRDHGEGDIFNRKPLCRILFHIHLLMRRKRHLFVKKWDLLFWLDFLGGFGLFGYLGSLGGLGSLGLDGFFRLWYAEEVLAG